VHWFRDDTPKTRFSGLLSRFRTNEPDRSRAASIPHRDVLGQTSTRYGRFACPSAPDHHVNHRVEDNHQCSKYELNFPGETGGIDQWQQIMLDEVPLIASMTSRSSKSVLEGCQWADAPGQFDKSTPGRRWYVKPWHPAPSQSQQAAERNEQDEQQVEQDDQVGK
jgi:hypothetical protein